MSDAETIAETIEPVPAPRRPLPRWVQVTVLLVVFASGAVVGAMIATKAIHSRMETYRQQAPIFSNDIVARLRVRLDLSDGQAERVRDIVERRHARMIELRREGSQSMHAEFNAMEQEVAAVLDDQQMQHWHRIADFVRQRFLPPMTSGG